MTPETMRAVRTRTLKLSRRKLGLALGYSGRQLENMENGTSPVPKWMPMALAWLHNYGETTPFDDA